MSPQDFFMLAVAVFGGASALLVVTSRNVVHAALYLVAALLSVAFTFLLVGAEFLAWAQVLVYVGAVVVLILFGLMLTRAPIGPMPQAGEQTRLAFVVSASLFGLLTVLILRSFDGVVFEPTHTRTAELGEVLYVAWAFPFIVVGFLLTVALIGAIVIARREEGEGPEPDDVERPVERPAPVPTDASSTPGVTEAESETGPPAATSQSPAARPEEVPS